jgi:hypothetical protein
VRFKHCYIVLLLCILCVCCASILFLNAAVPGDPFVINHDRKTYQAGNQNWSIAAGRHGFIYIANNNGLLEFDGSNRQIYTLENNMVFRSVAVGNDDKIYIGGYEEFGYFKRDLQGILHYTSLSAETLEAEFELLAD